MQFDDQPEPKFENIEDEDDIYAVEPMNDLCSEYVAFLMEEKKQTTVVENEISKV